MSTDLALTTPSNGGLLMDMETWNQSLTQCSVLVKSGFLPKGIDTPEKAMLVACKAYDLKIGLMAAFDGMAVFNGRICMFGSLALALFRRVPGHVFDVVEHSDTICRVNVGRPGMKTREISFTIEEAKRAGLLGKDNWKNYPKDMLMWRVVARANKQVFSDVTGGMNLQEEMETIDVQHRDNTEDKAKAAQNLLGAGKAKVESTTPAPEAKEPEATEQPPRDENALANPKAVEEYIKAFGKLGISEEVLLAEMMCSDRATLTVRDMEYVKKWYKKEIEAKK